MSFSLVFGNILSFNLLFGILVSTLTVSQQSYVPLDGCAVLFTAANASFNVCPIIILEGKHPGYYKVFDSKYDDKDIENYEYYFNIASPVRGIPDKCKHSDAPRPRNDHGYCNSDNCDIQMRLIPINNACAYQIKLINNEITDCWALSNDNPSEWSLIDPNNPSTGITLTYLNGDYSNHCGKNRQFSINLYCNNSETKFNPQSLFVHEINKCEYSLSINTSFGCPATKLNENNDILKENNEALTKLNKELNEMVLRLTKSNNDSMEENKRLIEINSDLRVSVVELTEQNKALTDSMINANKTVAILTKSENDLKENVKILNKNITKLSERNKQLKKDIKILNKSKNDLQKHFDLLKTSKNDLEEEKEELIILKNNLKQNIKELTTLNDTQIKEIERLKLDLDEKQIQLDSEEHKCSVDNADNERLKSRQSKDKKLYDQLRERKENIQNELDDCEVKLDKCKNGGWFG